MPTSIIKNSDIIQVLAPNMVPDEYNSLVEDWSSPVVVATGRASIQNYLAVEEDVDRQTTTEGFRLISDDPALFGVIQATHRINYDGTILEVTSPEQMWRFFNKEHHIELFVKVING